MPTISTQPKPSFLPPTISAGHRLPSQKKPKTAHSHGHHGNWPWDLTAKENMSTSLTQKARRSKASQIAALIKSMPVMGAQGLFGPNEERAPHHILRNALALALEDQKLSVPEALELRGLLLDLPAKQRLKYLPTLKALPLNADTRSILLSLNPRIEDYPYLPSDAFALISDPRFLRIFPNFSLLSSSEQLQVLEEITPFVNHFPEFLNRLNAIPNPHYGSGFQYFFVDRETNADYDHVLPEGSAGVIMPGPSAVKDPLLYLLVKKVSLRQLDRGGMYRSAIPYGVFSHEMAHVIHLNLLNDDQRDHIKNLYDTAWRENHFISEYSKTNPYEYFAEGVEAYLTGDRQALATQDKALYQFIDTVFAKDALHKSRDGHLLNDPERLQATTSFQGGKVLWGATLARESDMVSTRHFEASITQEIGVLAGKNTVLGRAALGVKAGWKPADKPASVYATLGGVTQAGYSEKAVSIGAGGFVGLGADYGPLNLEVRKNWIGGHNVSSDTEVRLGFRWEF